jgi:hypothetical protein
VGTLFSQPQLVDFTQASSLSIQLSQQVQPAASPGCSGTGVDTDYIKTVSVQSELLSQFWGRPITIQACVLLPWGFAEHPTARYPLVVAHGHYSATWDAGGRFAPQPPAQNLTGYDKIDAEYAHWLYTNWTSDSPSSAFYGSRMMVVTLNHAVPFFDDSYAVDSANVGPYGSRGL